MEERGNRSVKFLWVQIISLQKLHPSIFFRLSGPKSWWQHAQQGPRDFLLLSNNLLPLLGYPRLDEIYKPSSGFWVCLKVSSQKDFSGKGEVPGRHPN